MIVRLDKNSLTAILAAIKKGQIMMAEIYQERWVTGSELCKEIQHITKDWLDNYGWKLPRERIEVTCDDGKKRVTRWGYPINEIKRMIHEGRLREI